MEILSNIAGGFATVLTVQNLLFCFAGVAMGTFIGVLPGLGAMLGIALLLPVTYYLTPEAAIIMLAGIYYGGEYGGSISAILINVPGTPSSAVATLDGHEMTKQGRAAVALFTSAVASFAAGSVGIVLMMLFSPLIAQFALSFGSLEYFSVLLLGLVGAASVAKGARVKALLAVVLGVLLGSVGTDISTGVQRYSFGVPEFITGISLVALAMGVFGFAEIVSSSEGTAGAHGKARIRLRDMVPSRAEIRASLGPFRRGTAVGAFLGALPGTGPTIASFMAYSLEKRVSRDPGRFGKGAIEGLVAPESANNAAAQTAFIPTLTLGIPGTATMALILGALIIQGIQPGPRLMVENEELFWALIASFWIGNLFLLILNIPLVGLWVRLVRIPYRFLFPSIICLISLGVYSVQLSPFGVFVVIGTGMLGYGMRVVGIPAAPFLMGFILGPPMEENLRRALMLARGDFTVFVTSPISAVCVLLASAAIVWPTMTWGYGALKRRRRV
ncbi:tripartite tricarboxylate transporter permease [Aestuariivita sp.]|jgi:TctA family transporter|uniref:tripartite tricarboxylate transporter permease n=1 Tax=Aestuariivita sp. TaxID=1872407 RepID=UPI00216CA34F|nr:tripartite tricarboxylate transporter permease [Aestuariivita sp.]MCE8005629.1 tripartite tricarboxylate transporter permease [Aestuariivita sp.]